MRVVQDSADTSRSVGDSETNVIRGQVPNDAPVGWRHLPRKIVIFLKQVLSLPLERGVAG